MSLDTLQDILGAVATCVRCKLHKSRDRCVFAEGRGDARVMLIGLSPGKEENATGRLFIGPSGNFLNELLQMAGIKRESLYITNIIKCHAPTYSIGKTEIAACAPYLDRQIIKPSAVVPLGAVATNYILEKYNLSKRPISEIHGQRYNVKGAFPPLRDVQTIPMFHPAAALRNPFLEETIKKDWKDLRDNGLE